VRSALYNADHESFRGTFRKFVDKEIVPYHEEWEAKGQVPRELWTRAGAEGFLCPWMPEEYGGAGADFLYSSVIAEELARAGAHGPAFVLHSDIVVPYIFSFGNDEQKKRFLPGCVTGEVITALGMSEPNAGSDLAGIRTAAVKKDGHYQVNGSKIFISNGQICDLVVAAVKTNPAADPPHAGVSMMLIEAKADGFVRGKNLKKMGLKAQDTSELFFEDCKVPVANLLGEEGNGFYYMMQKLQQERLMIAIGGQCGAERCLELTKEYVLSRKAFGKPVSKFQNTQFVLAEVATDIALGRAFLDRVIADHMKGEDVVEQASMAKWWHTDMCQRVADQCLQLFGGYGYMLEYPISKLFLDARVARIFGGTNEIMKTIIAKRMGL
jgi:acyl-CoA dehydrogenase